MRERLRSEAAGEPWAYKLPHPATVVVEREVYDALNNVSDILTFAYQSGYYDGKEKQFRGYEITVQTTKANDFQSAGFDRSTFNVGKEDHYYNGLLLQRDVYGIDENGESVLFTQTRNVHEECPVAGIPDDLPANQAVRFICQTASIIDVVEDAHREIDDEGTE